MGAPRGHPTPPRLHHCTVRILTTSIEAVILLLLLLLVPASRAQSGANVLLVVNGNSAVSTQIGAYYRPRRSIPVANVCTDRKSTRLNSSHLGISYAVFCLKKKKKKNKQKAPTTPRLRNHV